MPWRFYVFTICFLSISIAVSKMLFEAGESDGFLQIRKYFYYDKRSGSVTELYYLRVLLQYFQQRHKARYKLS